MLRGNASTLLRTVEPVVVNPETVSKNASAKDGMEPLKMKGSEPKKERISHIKLTVTKPSLAYEFLSLGFFRHKMSPAISIATAGTRNVHANPSR